LNLTVESGVSPGQLLNCDNEYELPGGKTHLSFYAKKQKEAIARTRLTNFAQLSRYFFSGLHGLAQHCAPGRVRMAPASRRDPSSFPYFAGILGVRLKGFEPPTPGLGMRREVLLPIAADCESCLSSMILFPALHAVAPCCARGGVRRQLISMFGSRARRTPPATITSPSLTPQSQSHGSNEALRLLEKPWRYDLVHHTPGSAFQYSPCVGSRDRVSSALLVSQTRRKGLQEPDEALVRVQGYAKTVRNLQRGEAVGYAS
jgi:hypothetical protein